MEYFLLFLRMASLTGVFILTSMASASGMTLANSGCLDDNHCDTGYFCNTRTQACVSCEEIDCGKYLRLPGTSKCTKSKNECGPCITGYKLIHGHCRPAENVPTFLKPTNKSDDDTYSASGASSVSLFSFGLVMVGVLIVAGIAVTLTCFYRKMKNVYTDERKVPGGQPSSPMEYTEQPPAYNFSAFKTPTFPITNCRNMLDYSGLTQAVPFQLGNFGENVEMDLTQFGQVVPDNDFGGEDNLPPSEQPAGQLISSTESLHVVPEMDMDMDVGFPPDDDLEFFPEDTEPVEEEHNPPPAFPFEFNMGFHLSVEAFISIFQLMHQHAEANLVPVVAPVGAPDENLDESSMHLGDEY